MVKGNFKCIGTPQHIKNRYGEGFEVEIKMNSIPRATIDAIIVEKLKGVRNVRRGELPIVLKSLNADPLDAQELAIGRNGGYIVSNMSETKMSEVFPVV